jgi:hypothetical protein
MVSFESLQHQESREAICIGLEGSDQYFSMAAEKASRNQLVATSDDTVWAFERRPRAIQVVSPGDGQAAAGTSKRILAGLVAQRQPLSSTMPQLRMCTEIRSPQTRHAKYRQTGPNPISRETDWQRNAVPRAGRHTSQCMGNGHRTASLPVPPIIACCSG